MGTHSFGTRAFLAIIRRVGRNHPPKIGARGIVLGAEGFADLFQKFLWFFVIFLGGGGCFFGHCGFSVGMLKSAKLVYVILTYDRLKSEINLGIRIQEVDKDLGRETASETLVERILHNYR